MILPLTTGYGAQGIIDTQKTIDADESCKIKEHN